MSAVLQTSSERVCLLQHNPTNYAELSIHYDQAPPLRFLAFSVYNKACPPFGVMLRSRLTGSSEAYFTFREFSRNTVGRTAKNYRSIPVVGGACKSHALRSIFPGTVMSRFSHAPPTTGIRTISVSALGVSTAGRVVSGYGTKTPTAAGQQSLAAAHPLLALMMAYTFREGFGVSRAWRTGVC